MQKQIKLILEQLDPNHQRPELQDTPERVSDALRYLTQGYRINIPEIFSTGVFQTSQSELILIKNIEFYSLCEHHLLPFFGKCHIAYIPNKTILGLSKFATVVDIFARRLQIQENLGEQIAACLQQYLDPKGLAVILDAQHLCLMMQGTQKQAGSFHTQHLLGELKTSYEQQKNLFQLIKG